jgi:hypothetical protein
MNLVLQVKDQNEKVLDTFAKWIHRANELSFWLKTDNDSKGPDQSELAQFVKTLKEEIIKYLTLMQDNVKLDEKDKTDLSQESLKYLQNLTLMYN